MNTELPFLLLGVSHRSAPLDLRERLAMTDDEVSRKLQELVRSREVNEAFLLSTCLRTEVLIATPESPTDGSLEGWLREQVFDTTPRDAVYGFHGLESVLHLFRVGAGLDSVVLGESQVLAQMKNGLALARAAGAMDRLFEPLLQQALATGRRVRRDTRVGDGTLSIARAGVEVAARVFGRFQGITATIVGAGETGRLAARHLRDLGVGRLVFVNRTPERALEAASELGGEGFGLDELPRCAAETDFLLVCVEDSPALVNHGVLAQRRRKDQPLVLMDLSLPRAIDPALAKRKDVLLYDLDDLAGIVEEHREERERASAEAVPILLAEVHKFLGLRQYARFVPTIQRLQGRFDKVREEEIDTCAGEHASAEMMQLAHRLTRHLLDVALEELKENARDTVAPEYLDKAYQRFLENL